MHYLYKITCLVNGKNYIGQTVQPHKRWNQHRNDAANPRMVIHHSINKYGAHNFSFEVLATCQTQDQANVLEFLLIEQYSSHISTGLGYNISLGGSVAPKSVEWKTRMSQTMKGKRISRATEFKLGHPTSNSGKTHFKEGHKTWNLGKTWDDYSPEVQEALTKGHAKTRKFTEATVACIRFGRAMGLSWAKLAAQFNTTQSTVRGICEFKLYKTKS